MSDKNDKSVKDMALYYAGAGFRVFPCQPERKTPATQHGVKDASANPERIARWWSGDKDAARNVTVATDGLLVVDVDGPDNPWPNDPARQAELEATLWATTPRGGRHYYFRQPEGAAWRNSAGKLAKAVDTRAGGGYVLTPPSVVDGKAYRWSGRWGGNTVADLPLPPTWLIKALAATVGADGARVHAPSTSADDAGPTASSSYGFKALLAEAARVAASASWSRRARRRRWRRGRNCCERRGHRDYPTRRRSSRSSPGCRPGNAPRAPKRRERRKNREAASWHPPLLPPPNP